MGSHGKDGWEPLIYGVVAFGRKCIEISLPQMSNLCVCVCVVCCVLCVCVARRRVDVAPRAAGGAEEAGGGLRGAPAGPQQREGTAVHLQAGEGQGEPGPAEETRHTEAAGTHTHNAHTCTHGGWKDAI